MELIVTDAEHLAETVAESGAKIVVSLTDPCVPLQLRPESLSTS